MTKASTLLLRLFALCAVLAFGAGAVGVRALPLVQILAVPEFKDHERPQAQRVLPPPAHMFVDAGASTNTFAPLGCAFL